MYKDIYKTYKKVSKDFINRNLFNKSTKSNEDVVKDIKENKIAIYTAFTAGYDNLKEPEFIDENCDYICFTDIPDLKSDFWDIRQMNDSTFDGTFKIRNSIREYVYKYIKHNSNILCVLHPERDCVYNEFKFSKKITRYPANIMKKQVLKYENDGFSKNQGLFALGAIFRKHNSPEIVKLMEDWWSEIIEFSNQDQISFPYVVWKNKIKPSVSNIYYWNNEYWYKEGNYHHKVLLTNPSISNNLINKLKEKISSDNTSFNLSKEELYTLINEIEGLKGHDEYMSKKIEDNEKEKELILNSNSLKITKFLRK
jgi:O-antigen biosynthesis protein